MSMTLSDVKKHKKATDAWVVIHNDVYDLTKFLHEHPGGPDTILGVAGSDATVAFEDVGHSDDARAMMGKYKIGTLRLEDRATYIEPCGARTPSMKGKSPPVTPKVEPHVPCIIVPRQRRPRGYPCEKRMRRRPTSLVPPKPPPKSRWWLWVLLAVGVAAGGAFAYKKYAA